MIPEAFERPHLQEHSSNNPNSPEIISFTDFGTDVDPRKISTD
jgi:hypothetical protein